MWKLKFQMFLEIALKFWCLQWIEGKTYGQFLQPPTRSKETFAYKR
jgi:hypothetical protein